MIFGLFKRYGDPTTDSLYAAIVAQARQPVFYLDFGVEDTLDGRFDMIVLHLALVIRRLKDGEAAAHEAARAVTETFITDMDRNLREIGIADLRVPKKVREMVDAFYGRAAAYEAALSREGGDDLADAIKRNIFVGREAAPSSAMAAYVRAAAERLSGLALDALARGGVEWPDPLDFVPEGSSV